MKLFITKKPIVVLALLVACTVHAQVLNPFANPFSQSIGASAFSIPLGRMAVSTFELGNNGSDPIPAGGATWNISFPPNITPDQSSLNMNGAEDILAPSWSVINGVTYLTLNVTGTGIPAKVFRGPKTKFTMTVNIAATSIGDAGQQTINCSYDASVSQNLNPGDDNAYSPISVEQAIPVQAYPNPASDLVKIAGAAAGNDIVLYDINGKLLQAKKSSGSLIDELKISQYPKGMYVIKISDGATYSIIKLLKQ